MDGKRFVPETSSAVTGQTPVGSNISRNVSQERNGFAIGGKANSSNERHDANNNNHNTSAISEASRASVPSLNLNFTKRMPSGDAHTGMSPVRGSSLSPSPFSPLVSPPKPPASAADPGVIASSPDGTPLRRPSPPISGQNALNTTMASVHGTPNNLLMSSSLLAIPALDPSFLRQLQNNSANPQRGGVQHTTTITTANGSFVIPNKMLGTLSNLNLTNDSIVSLQQAANSIKYRNQSLAGEMADQDFVLKVPAGGDALAVSRTNSVSFRGGQPMSGGGSLRNSIATSPSISNVGRGGGASISPGASVRSPRSNTSRRSGSSVSREARRTFGKTKAFSTTRTTDTGASKKSVRGKEGNAKSPGGSSAAVPIDTPSSSDGEGAVSKRSDLKSERSSKIFAAATNEKHSSHSSGWFDEFEEEEDNESSFNANALYDVFQGKGLTIRKRIKYILDGNPHHMDATKSAVINGGIFLAICVSIVVFCVSSFPSFYNESNVGLQAVEAICVAIFILEAIGRIVSCSNFRSLLTFFFAIDVIAIIGYFLDLILRLAVSGGGGAGLSVVRVVRLVRVFRVIKVSRHSASLQVILLVIKSSMPSLVALVIPIILVAVIAACLLYYVETSAANYTWDGDKRVWTYRKLGTNKIVTANIQSIPDTLWFAFATVTTVGFGDTTVVTIGARTLAALLQLTGVLMVNFPNIILGGNVQVAYKDYHRQKAVRKLGKRFRRVYMCVCFISALRDQVALRKAIAANEEWAASNPDATLQGDSAADVAHNVGDGVDETKEGGGDDAPRNDNGKFYARVDGRIATAVGRSRKKPQTNYLIQEAEARNYRKEGVSPIDVDNIRQWQYKDVPAVKILQRLLERCSGVGTTEELYQTFVDNGDGGVTLKDIDIVCLYLLAAGYLQLFAFKRFGVNILCSLTTTSVTELMVNPEEGQVDCIRSAEMARVLWRRTTGTTVSFSLSLLGSTYQIWSATEKVADNERYTPYSDMKVLYDEEGNAKPMPNSFFSQSVVGLDRTASFRLGANAVTAKAREAARKIQEENDTKLREEAKETMKDVIAQRRDYIASLKEKIDNATAMAKASSNFVSVVAALNKAARRPSALPTPRPSFVVTEGESSHGAPSMSPVLSDAGASHPSIYVNANEKEVTS